MNKDVKCFGVHLPFAPWKCGHGWDDEKEGKPCPACNGYCLSCGENKYKLDHETGLCLVCQDVFDSDYEFYKESSGPHEYPGNLEEILNPEFRNQATT